MKITCSVCRGDFDTVDALETFEFDEGFEFECPLCGKDTWLPK